MHLPPLDSLTVIGGGLFLGAVVWAVVAVLIGATLGPAIHRHQNPGGTDA